MTADNLLENVSFIYILSMLKKQKTLEIRIDKLSEIIDDGIKRNTN